MNKKGLISVKMLLLSVMMISIFLIFFVHLKQRNAINNALREQSVILNSSLANYDTYLYKNYGLYGVSQPLALGSYKTGFHYTLVSEALTAKKDLSDSQTLKNQITTFMVYRMPGNFIEQMKNKLDIITDSQKTKKTIDLKNKVYDYLAGFDDLLQQRGVYTLKVNGFNYEDILLEIQVINGSWTKWYVDYKIIKGEIQEAQLTLESAFKAYEDYKRNYLMKKNPTSEETLLLETKKSILLQARMTLEAFESQGVDYEFYGQEILKQLDKIVLDLQAILTSHEDLIELMMVLKEKKINLSKIIDETIIALEASDGLEAVLEELENELVSLKHQLNDEMVSEEKLSLIITQLNSNQKILKNFIKSFVDEKSVFDHETLVDLSTVEGLKTYKNDFKLFQDDGTYKADEDKEAQYQASKEELEEAYEPKAQGIVIKKEVEIIKTKGSGKFWAVAEIKNHLKESYQEMMVNEYLMSTFKCYGNPSDSDFDFFEKYQRTSFFRNGEIEYILFGQASESKNITRTLLVIYGVRSLMNTMHIYMDPEKIAFSEAIGWGVAGWTGFLAPVVTQVIRLAWAAGESALDMKDLIAGQGVAFLKMYPSQWHLDLGFISKNKEKPLKALQLTYHDYLRFMLLTVKSDTKLSRLQNLLSLNLYSAQRPHGLFQYKTTYESQRVIKLSFGNYKSILEKGYE